jgi:hypothetical protein
VHAASSAFLGGHRPATTSIPNALEGDGLRCVRSKLEEAIDKDRAEQFGRAPRRIEDLTGCPGILSTYRFTSGMGMIDTVYGISEIAYDVPLSGKSPTTTIAAFMVPALSLGRGTISGSFPVRFLSSTPFRNGSQRRY